MRSKTITLMGLALLGGALLAPGQNVMVYHTAQDTPPPAGARVMSNTFEFVRSEFGSNAVVKGAPYSAEAVTESVQTLADGNRITHKDATTIARDSEGRTRRDLALPAIPGVDPAELPKFSFIFDATTNTSYTLDHKTRTARKSSGKMFNIQVSQTTRTDAKGNVLTHDIAGPATATIRQSVVEKSGSQARVVMMDVAGGVAKTGMPPQGASTSLGKQTIEGVVAEGTRTVHTIPAGEMGNERPIEIVAEQWYSPELKMVILSKNSDPRSGETTYRVTNLRRGEPLKSLFEVPADYSVKAENELAEPVKIRMIRPPQED